MRTPRFPTRGKELFKQTLCLHGWNAAGARWVDGTWAKTKLVRGGYYVASLVLRDCSPWFHDVSRYVCIVCRFIFYCACDHVLQLGLKARNLA